MYELGRWPVTRHQVLWAFWLLTLVVGTLGESAAQEDATPQARRDFSNRGTITVYLDEIKVMGGGKIIINLFNSEEWWLENKRTYKRQTILATERMLTITFENVPYDTTYAITVIHDTNDNDELDMRKFPWPKPKEGWGVSNNKKRIGKPKYGDARFDLTAQTLSVRILLRY